MNDNIRLRFTSVLCLQCNLYFIFTPFREARLFENRFQHELTPRALRFVIGFQSVSEIDRIFADLVIQIL